MQSPLQVSCGFKAIGSYQVRRASATSAIQKIWAQFKAIEAGEVDIGENCRGHTAKTAYSKYDM